jgi:hypothetical protein
MPDKMDLIIIERILFYLVILCYSVAGFAGLMLILNHCFNNKDVYIVNPRVSKIAFCRKGVEWCAHNIGLPKSRAYPNVKLTYTKKEKELGHYDIFNSLIVIHYNNRYHSSLKMLCNTIIHEYVHHLQFISAEKSVEYNSELNDVGYWYNKFEVEARRVSDKNEKELLNFFIENNYIIRKPGRK